MPTLTYEAKSACSSLGLTPARHRGQNFCISDRVLAGVAAAAELRAGDTALEIGPGLGFLTRHLLDTGADVVAIELQKEFAAYMREKFSAEKNLTVVQDDALDFLEKINDSTDVIARVLPKQSKSSTDGASSGLLRSARNDVTTGSLSSSYTAVGMVPYNITSRLFRVLLESPRPPARIVFVIQKDVALRMAAKPGSMSLLSVSCQYLAQVEVLAKISAANFWPKPQVDSALVRLTPRLVEKEEREAFFRVLHAAFAHKRKKVFSNIRNEIDIAQEDLERIFLQIAVAAGERAENLTMEQWELLTKNIKKYLK